MNSKYIRKNDEITNRLRVSLASNEIQKFILTFLSLHVSDQATFFLELNERKRETVLKSLKPSEFAGIFQELSLDDRRLIVAYLDSKYVTEMLNFMVSIEAAAFVRSLSRRKAASLLNAMQPEARTKVERILKYPVDSSGALIHTEFQTVDKADTVEAVLNRLRLSSEDNYYFLYVTNQDLRLIGVVLIHQLLRARSDSKMEMLMNTNIISIHDHADQTNAADLIKKYDLHELPVTDQDGIMIGIIKVDDVLDLLEERMTQRIQNIAALKSGLSFSSSTFRLVTQRLPWLIGLTVLGFLMTKIMAPFIASLEHFTTLALFIPVILAMSGNGGIQSLSVVIRRMSVSPVRGKDSWYLLGKEAGIGVLTGFVCGVFATVLSILLLDSSLMFSTIVGLALFISVLFGTITGAILPLIVKHLNIDPAIASGPVVTTLTDVVALLIYYSVSTLLIPFATS
ncbi:magnesium transporter [Paenibacillus uliginis N3/975]|uniref:Magnesium transporter MgtE n=1 Tax=Paenibacillus uliginis N3/975 TaxID=1313296 RepID=A0A1X7HES4_9BACL|nr:magnesium transporter [Paenibacillus uliginis]SMF84689.1 magnesium transporter [Paenibacillus uliginis N3/975]